MSKCPKCNKEIPNNSKFCLYCGALCKEIKKCPSCGEEVDDSSLYCSHCGYNLNSDYQKEQQRKYEEYLREVERVNKKIQENSKYIKQVDDYVYFGSYPQTIKKSNVTIYSKMDSRGYYLGSDGNYYEKKKCQTESKLYNFSDGSICENNKTEYFLVEPIKWRISEKNNKQLTLTTDMAIDVHRFDGSENIYSKSELHSWLNNEFLNKAFNTYEENLISFTNVVNLPYNSGDDYHIYLDKETRDKVYLMDYQRASVAMHRYSLRKPTDYAIASNIWINVFKDNIGNCCYWLRSPYCLGTTYDKTYARIIGHQGSLAGKEVKCETVGIVPILKVQLDK